MSTGKIIFMIAGILAVIILLIAIFVGGIIGLALYSIGNSQAAETARNFLRNNEKLKQDIGEIKEFGSIVTGSVNTSNENGDATINIKVVGTRETVNASVNLLLVKGQTWRVSSASYISKSGETITLMDPYESLIFLLTLAA